MLVSSINDLSLPGVYSLEIEPLNTVSGIATGVVAILGTSTRGSNTETSPYSSYDEDFIKAYGSIYAEGNKKDVKNYTSLPLGMLGIAQNGGATVYPIRIGKTSGSGQIAKATVTISSGANTYTISGTTPGTYLNGATITVANDSINPANKAITLTVPKTSEQEIYAEVDNFMDDLNANSTIVDVELTSGTVEFLPANGTYTLSGGSDGITYGAMIPYGDFIGEDNLDGTATGLQLLKRQKQVRLFALSEHYATLVDSNGDPDPNGTELDPVTLECIQVANAINAIGILNIDPTLTDAQILNLTAITQLKATDRIILTGPKERFFERTYKTNIERSYSPLYLGAFANLSPNESPSNKVIVGGAGPTRKYSDTLLKLFSKPLNAYSVVGEIPRGGIGALNGLNTSNSTGLNQSLRRRMADFLFISVDQALGEFVSDLHNPRLRQKAFLKLDLFFSKLAESGLIGDSNGGQPYELRISAKNNTTTTVLARELNIYFKAVLFTPADFIIGKGSVGFEGVNLTVE